MKKYLAILLTLAMLTSLAACGGDTSSDPVSTPDTGSSTTTTTTASTGDNGGDTTTGDPTEDTTAVTDPTESTAATDPTGATTPSGSGTKPTGSNATSKTTTAKPTTKPTTKPTSKPLVDGPAASSLASYDLTAARIKDAAAWDANLASYSVKVHGNGVMQIGNGTQTQTEAYAAYTDKDGTLNKLVNMDVMFYCPSELAATPSGTHEMQGKGQILFRATKVSNMGRRNPCYVLEYEDCGNFSLRLLKYDSKGQAAIGKQISVESLYKPYEYNRLQVGFFNEDGGVRILVYLNGTLVLNQLDKNASADLKKAGYIVFQNEKSTVLLRGVDSKVGVPDGYAVPKPVKKVGNHQTYDISGLKDYDFRCLATVMEAREWKDDNGVTIPYRLYLPTNYSKDKKYPMAIYLHGLGTNGSDNFLQIGGDVAFHKAYLDYQKTEEFIYVVPQCPDYCWNVNDLNINTLVGGQNVVVDTANSKESATGVAVFNLFQALTKEFSVNTKRVYLSGASAGGLGTYAFMGRHPEFFAAGIVGCGVGDLTLAGKYPPLVIAHGALDTAVYVKYGQQMRDAIKAAGGEVKYYEYPDRYHSFGVREEIREYIQWIFQKSR